MSKQLGPIEVCCDAPPYWVVRACRDLGVRTPEDVRWLRLSPFVRRNRAAGHNVVSFVVRLFRGPAPRLGDGCTCGARLPELNVSLVVVDGVEPNGYRLGQCPQCRTVFWEAP